MGKGLNSTTWEQGTYDSWFEGNINLNSFVGGRYVGTNPEIESLRPKSPKQNNQTGSGGQGSGPGQQGMPGGNTGGPSGGPGPGQSYPNQGGGMMANKNLIQTGQHAPNPPGPPMY